MKVVHVVPQIRVESSGPSVVIRRLAECLAARGNDVTVACLDAAGALQNGVRLDVYRRWPGAKSFGFSLDFARHLPRTASQADIVHNHSLWSMVNVATGLIVPGRKAQLITSPHGTLSAWALSRSRWRKSLLWGLQKRVLTQAALLHATSDEEYQQIRMQGFSTPVAIIPNGIDLPRLATPKPQSDHRTLLFLSRIHPIKGIENLLDAWASVEDTHNDWQLIIAGPGNASYLRSLENRVSRYGLRRVGFLGPLFGSEKSTVYRNADLFVLPSYSENFAMVVAEALAHECPVIVSHGAPWHRLKEEGCGWWISNDVESLRRTLQDAMSRPPAELRDMGRKGRVWMARDFCWDSVAHLMEAAYQWVLNGGDVPPSVRVE